MKEKLNKLVGFARKCKGKARVVAMTAVATVMMSFSAFAAEGDASGSVLSSVVTADMLNGVLDEIIALLPIVFPVSIAFIGIRKGIAFVKSALRSA